jgi:hypothetical protein
LVGLGGTLIVTMSMTPVCGGRVSVHCWMVTQVVSSLRVAPASPTKFPWVIWAASG